MLSSKPYIGNDGPTNQEGNEQTKSSRANGAVGNWTKPIWHQVQALNNDKSLGISWFYCWIYFIGRWEYVRYINFMDGQHRWIVSTKDGQSQSLHYFPGKRHPKIWSTALIPCHQQLSRVRGNINGAQNGKIFGSKKSTFEKRLKASDSVIS